MNATLSKAALTSAPVSAIVGHAAAAIINILLADVVIIIIIIERSSSSSTWTRTWTSSTTTSAGVVLHGITLHNSQRDVIDSPYHPTTPRPPPINHPPTHPLRSTNPIRGACRFGGKIGEPPSERKTKNRRVERKKRRFNQESHLECDELFVGPDRNSKRMQRRGRRRPPRA